MKRNLRPEEDSRGTTKLSSLEERIYSTDNPVFFKDRRSVLRSSAEQVQTKWSAPEEEVVAAVPLERTESTFFKKLSHRIFYFAVISFVSIVGYTSYTLYFNSDAIINNKIGFAMQTPSFIDGGRVFPVDIYVTNNNRATMERVDIVLEYPKGESSTNASDTVVKRIALGNVVGGATAKGLGEMVLYGREGNIRTIKAYAEFYAPGSSVVRKKDLSKTITLKSAPVVIVTESLKEVPSNSELAYTVRVRAERGIDLNDFVLQIVYPNGFTYTRASEEPRTGNNTWYFEQIDKGTEKSITVYGRMRGEDDDERVFRVTGGSQDTWNKGQIGIVFADTKSSVVIKKPFISITGNFAGMPMTTTGEFVVAAGRPVEGTLLLRNNIPDTISNIIVEAKLVGEILNRNKVQVQNGYFDSSRNTLVWNQSTKKSLRELLPGDELDLSFTLESYGLSAKNGAFFSEPKITIEPTAKAKRLSDTNVPEVYSTSNPLVLKVMTEIGLTGKAYYTPSPFAVVGPFPPQVEQKTSYVLELAVANKANALENTVVSFTLPPYVEYAGTFTPEDKDVRYNSATREVTWSVGTILPGTGLGLREEKVYIALTATPSTLLLGTKLDIPGTVYITGRDKYTETVVSSSYGPIRLEEKVR